MRPTHDIPHPKNNQANTRPRSFSCPDEQSVVYSDAGSYLSNDPWDDEYQGSCSYGFFRLCYKAIYGIELTRKRYSKNNFSSTIDTLTKLHGSSLSQSCKTMLLIAIYRQFNYTHHDNLYITNNRDKPWSMLGSAFLGWRPKTSNHTNHCPLDSNYNVFRFLFNILHNLIKLCSIVWISALEISCRYSIYKLHDLYNKSNNSLSTTCTVMALTGLYLVYMSLRIVNIAACSLIQPIAQYQQLWKKKYFTFAILSITISLVGAFLLSPIIAPVIVPGILKCSLINLVRTTTQLSITHATGALFACMIVARSIGSIFKGIIRKVAQPKSDDRSRTRIDALSDSTTTSEVRDQPIETHPYQL